MKYYITFVAFSFFLLVHPYKSLNICTGQVHLKSLEYGEKNHFFLQLETFL